MKKTLGALVAIVILVIVGTKTFFGIDKNDYVKEGTESIVVLDDYSKNKMIVNAISQGMETFKKGSVDEKRIKLLLKSVRDAYYITNDDGTYMMIDLGVKSIAVNKKIQDELVEGDKYKTLTVGQGFISAKYYVAKVKGLYILADSEELLDKILDPSIPKDEEIVGYLENIKGKASKYVIRAADKNLSKEDINYIGTGKFEVGKDRLTLKSELVSKNGAFDLIQPKDTTHLEKFIDGTYLYVNGTNLDKLPMAEVPYTLRRLFTGKQSIEYLVDLNSGKRVRRAYVDGEGVVVNTSNIEVAKEPTNLEKGTIVSMVNNTNIPFIDMFIVGLSNEEKGVRIEKNYIKKGNNIEKKVEFKVSEELMDRFN